MRYLLGDYEKKGETLKGLGKFFIFSLDDPFHLTTLTGLAFYALGKARERSTNYGLRMFAMDYSLLKLELKDVLFDFHSCRL
ncbi:MAG: hypothetical protein JHC23_04250 [Sulfolobus sp.]|nr:hypothetical protein [Sulfolobus sp.]